MMVFCSAALKAALKVRNWVDCWAEKMVEWRDYLSEL